VVAFLSLAAALGVAGGEVVAGPAAAAQPDCAGADQVPRSGAILVARSAMLCLLNAERSLRGLPVLAEQRQVTRAAAHHARDMVRSGYFDHTDLAGAGVAQRLQAAGYPAVTVAEDLAWGTGPLGSPRATFQGWMDSRPHREAILNARFVDVGIGIAPGVPDGGELADGATYAVDFGTS
jgi:uncharacterized protein YkwD